MIWIQRVVHRRFQRLIVRRERTVFQSRSRPYPAQPIRMQREWRFARDRVHALRALLRLIIRSLGRRKVRIVAARPLVLRGVPPDELLALAPRLPIRTRRGAVVDDAAVLRPRKPPTMSKEVVRLLALRKVLALFGIMPAVDPTSGCGRTVVFQVVEVRDQLTVRQRVAVDLLVNHIHDGLVVRTFDRVVPSERAQWRVDRIRILRRKLLQARAEVVDEVRLAASVALRLDCLLVPLQQTLCVGEGAVFLYVRCGSEEEHLGANVLRTELSAFYFGRVIPEARRLRLEQVAYHQPLQLAER